MADQSNGNGSLNVSHPPAHDSTNSAASNAPNGGRGAPPQAGAPPPPTNGGPLAAAPVASHDPTLAPAVQPPPSTATTTTANSSTTAPHDPHHRLRSTSPLAPVQPPPPSLPAAPLDGPRPSLPPPRPEGFVQPSSYLRRPRGLSRPMPPEPPPQQPSPLPPPRAPPTSVDRDQIQGLRKIRAFLKARTSYDVLPLSFRLIVFDTSLLVKNSLNILLQNGIASAPLWDSKTSTFAGLLTTSDYINVIQYYWQHPEAMSRIDQFRLYSLRDIEKALDVVPLETVSIHPLRPLYEACRRMLETRARRIPLVDVDDDTRRATLVNVVTQYRILKFVAVNVGETQLLRRPLRALRAVGTYAGLVTARMETPVIDVIHQLVRKSISSVPILNSDGIVVNVFEAVDVITLIKGGVYDDLALSVGEALQKRAPDFPGIYTCSLDDRLDTVFDTIRRSRVHRFVVVDEDKRLNGVLTLSDILQYILLEGEGDD